MSTRVRTRMSAPVRLGLYGLLLVVLFSTSALVARAVVPTETVRSWSELGRTHSPAPTAAAEPHDPEPGHR